MIPRCSKTIKVLLQNINAALGYSDVILLRDLNLAMTHLIAQQMRGRVHLRQHRSIGVPEVVIFEVNPQHILDFPCGVFQRMRRLQSAVVQAIHHFRGGYQPCEY